MISLNSMISSYILVHTMKLMVLAFWSYLLQRALWRKQLKVPIVRP